MGEKKPPAHAYPDQGGYVEHDQYYKPLEGRGIPPIMKKEDTSERDETAALFREYLDDKEVVPYLVSVCYALRNMQTGANVHKIANRLNVLRNIPDLLDDKAVTFGELRETRGELYEVTIEALIK